MIMLGKIAGGVIGFLVGGPVGAAAGVAIGAGVDSQVPHAIDDKHESSNVDSDSFTIDEEGGIFTIRLTCATNGKRKNTFNEVTVGSSVTFRRLERLSNEQNHVDIINASANIPNAYSYGDTTLGQVPNKCAAVLLPHFDIGRAYVIGIIANKYYNNGICNTVEIKAYIPSKDDIASSSEYSKALMTFPYYVNVERLNDEYLNKLKNVSFVIEPVENITSTESATLTKPTETIQCKVVGVTFDNRQQLISTLFIGSDVYLAREPSNSYDANAIAVLNNAYQIIGYIPKEIAARVANKLVVGQYIKGSVINKHGGNGLSYGLEIMAQISE